MAPDSDSDSDSVEEIQIKKYMNTDFGQAIRQVIALQNSHSGIKKQPGFYELRDRKQRQLDGKYYDGQHWPVSNWKQCARATRRLTQKCIDEEVDKERERRIPLEDTEKETAVKVLKVMHQEFNDTMQFSKKKMKSEEGTAKNHHAKVKDDMQMQLLNFTHAGLAAMETEQERVNQIKLLRAMLSNADKSPSVEDLVDSMSSTNQKRNYINRDLEEAFGRLQDDEKDLDDDYRVAMMEMLDESLIKVVLDQDREITRKMFEEEQLERVKEEHTLKKDKIKERAIEAFQKVHQDMKRVYQQVLDEEEKIEESYKDKVREIKSRVQDELTRKMARRWIERACADEKTRRIKEFAVGPKKNVAWDSMKNLMNRVQRQMILSKFDGKWVDLKQAAKKEKCTDTLQPETDQDRKMREMRTGSRRPSCVVRGDDD